MKFDPVVFDPQVFSCADRSSGRRNKRIRDKTVDYGMIIIEKGR